MYRIQWSCLVVLLVLSASHAQGQGPKLTWKTLDSKQPFFTIMTETTQQDVFAKGKKSRQFNKETFWFRWQPKGTGEGNHLVGMKVLALRIEIDIGGNGIEFDSRQKSAKNPMTDFFNSLVGAEFTLTIDPKTMSVKKVDGLDKVHQRVGAVNQAMAPLLEKFYSEKRLHHFGNTLFRSAPPGGVIPKGRQWIWATTEDNGFIGDFRTTNQYTYLGMKGNTHRIQIQSDVKFLGLKKRAGQAFQIVQAKFHSSKQKGQAIFDPQKGRLRSQIIRTKIAGNLTVKTGRKLETGTIETTMISETLVMDRNPLIKQ